MLGLAFVSLFVAIIAFFFTKKKKHVQEEKEDAEKPVDPTIAAKETAEYLSSKLKPTSSSWEILFFIATTPENIKITTNQLKKVDKMKEDRIRKLVGLKKAEKNNVNKLIEVDDDGGWASDDDDDEESKAAKKHDEDLKKQEQALNRSMGKVDPTDLKLEGVDKGVIGMRWVTERLKEKNIWPPRIPEGVTTFVDVTTGKSVSPSEHPAVTRNLTMTLARLNAMLLNSHPDLAKANATGNIDPTYFKDVFEFKQRNTMLLEVCLRIACAAGSYRLVKTIVQTVAMFQIGVMNATDPRVLTWFKKTMEAQYGGPDGVPRLAVKSKRIETPDEKEIATGDKCLLSIDVERVHAELFFKNKIALCQKQGIPPQVALQSFREVWWVLIRRKRTDGEEDGENEHATVPTPSPGSLAALASGIFDKNDPGDKLIHAYPFVVGQINKKEGTVKALLKAPPLAGKYTYLVSILSQEFLGCGLELEMKDVVIVDSKSVTREAKEQEVEETTDTNNDELKKEK